MKDILPVYEWELNESLTRAEQLCDGAELSCP